MRSPAEIVAVYFDRRGAQSGYLEDAREFTMAHDGELVVDLPELDAREENTMGNNLFGALNQQAMRIGGTGADCFYPPTCPGVEVHEKRARTKRQVTHGWWHHNGMRIKDRLRARWLIGYAAAPIQIRPPRSADRYRIPQWEPRSPLTAFPDVGFGPLDMEPGDCIFATARTWGWIRDNYPDLSADILRALPERDKVTGREAVFEVLEYDDADQSTTLVIGEARDPLRVVETDYGARGNQIHNLGRQGQGWNRWCAVLDDRPNRAGICGVVIPGLVTLGKQQGQYHGLPAMMRKQSQLWALQDHALRRGIFAETWFVHGGDGAIVTDADPYRGIVGEVERGEIKDIRVDPSFANLQAIDRYSAMMREEGMIPNEYSGRSTSGTRTGRRGEQVMEAVVDFPIQEAQDLLAASKEAENRRAIAVAKAYTRKVSFYVPAKGAKGQVTYQASELFDTDVNQCFYSHSGINPERVTVDGLQLVGADVMARRVLAEQHPMIEDAEANWDQIVAEHLDLATLRSLEARAMNGQVPESYIAHIRKDVKSGQKELHEAVIDEDEKLKAQQATPVDPNSPEAQMGLADPLAQQTAPAGPPGLEALLAQLEQGAA